MFEIVVGSQLDNLA